MTERLFTPGPVEVPAEALQAESRPLIHHRTPEFLAELKRAHEGLQSVFLTDDPVLIHASSGTGGMEAALVNTMNPGDAVVVVRGGKFADRWLGLARAYGAEVLPVEVALGHSVDPAEVERVFASRPGIRTLYCTHSETSTGARNDVRALADIARRHGSMIVVDAITSLGAMELRTKAWDLDVVVGGSQKGFMIAPGLAFTSVGARVKAFASECRTPRFYFDFRRGLKNWEAGDTAFTPAISLVRALVATLDLMLAEGLELMWARHARNATACRAAAIAMGLAIYPEHPTDSVTAVCMPEGLVSDDLIRAVRQRHGLRLANGQDELKGRIFRVGHLGGYRSGDILTVVHALEEVLASQGHRFERGVGVAAAARELSGVGK